MIRSIVVAASLGLVVLTSISVSRAAIYTGSSIGRIYTVNPLTGAAVLTSSLSITPTDIAQNPITGEFFAVTSNRLYKVNLATGTSTPVGSAGMSAGINGANALVFSPDGSLMYMAAHNTSQIYSLSLTGVATSLGSPGAGLTSSGDLEFFNGAFFWSAKGTPPNDKLVKINLGDVASSTVVGSFGLVNVYGLAADAGVLYGITEGNDVYSVNVTTAAMTYVSTVNLAGSEVPAFTFGASAVIPEPTSAIVWLVLALAFSGVGWWGRWRNPR